MKINTKTLSAVGALLLCSQSVSAATIEVYIRGERESDITIKGEIRKEEKLSLPNDPFTVVRSVTFTDNKLKEFTPEIENWLKEQKGITSFSIQENEFRKFPIEILKWFPHLKSIHFWDNPIESDSPELFYYGNLRTIDGLSKAFSCSRRGVNKQRQEEINRYNKEISDVKTLISNEEKELSSLQKQLEALEKQKLDLRKSKKSNRQKNFLRKDINKKMKAFSRKLVQTKDNITDLQEKKRVLESTLGKLENAQKESLKIGKREDLYHSNLQK